MRNTRMKLARVERDLNQEELARLVGVTRQTISLIESGDYNPPSTCKVSAAPWAAR